VNNEEGKDGQKAISDIRIDKDHDLLVCTVGLYKLFLAHGRTGHEALSLYLHLMFTARLQETNQIKANNEYLCRGLLIGKVKLRTLKALLHKLGLLEYVQKRNSNGQIAEQYIKIKLFTKKSLDNMILETNGNPKDKSCPTRINPVLEGQKTSGMVYRPSGASPQMLKEKKEMLKEKKENSPVPVPEPEQSSKKSKKQSIIPGYKEFTSELFKFHRQVTGQKYIFTEVDGSIVKKILRQLEIESSLEKLRAYYLQDWWFTKDGRSLKGFIAHINELSTNGGNGKTDPEQIERVRLLKRVEKTRTELSQVGIT